MEDSKDEFNNAIQYFQSIKYIHLFYLLIIASLLYKLCLFCV